jgi:predicted O-linked N-acetylglucosamine transferase (SPINDLY family)
MNLNIQEIFSRAMGLMQAGRVEEAELLLKELIQIDSNHHDAYHLLGIIYAGREKFDQAQIYFKEALRICPENPVYNSNYANSLQDSWKVEESFSYYRKAIQLNPDFVDAYFNLGNAYRKTQRFNEALESYAKALQINPSYIKALINIATVYEATKKFNEAINTLKDALKLDSHSYEVLSTIAILFASQKDYPQAMTYFKQAFDTGKADDKFYSNYGTVCTDMNNPKEAAVAFLKAAEIAPSKHASIGRALHQKMLIADWLGTTELNQEIVRRLHSKEDVVDPFGYMGYSESEADLQIAGTVYLKNKFPELPADFKIKKYPRHAKIKIAYVSGEYREHANGSLMTGLIECHDKNKFEVIGLDNGRGDDSSLRRRLLNAFDEFIDINNISDIDLTLQLREREVDILFNLNGFFGAHRTGLFANRAAPIQINFLGCPGTMGVDYMDYLIADNVVIPKSSYQYYDEKIISLPHTYQINDSKRPEVRIGALRKNWNLPEEAFVFCCFNNVYKITPHTFKRWMQILKRVPSSVLWFYTNYDEAIQNLKREAENQGVNSERLIFSPYINMYEHLDRSALADLFLDSLPYNAHTSASDALWANVPVLTLQGKSFAGRVAASLLHAIEMPELITYTEQEFEDRAVDLATHPEKLTALKVKLSKNRLTTPLFDTKLYTKHFESALIEAYERYQSDLPPAHIEVKP